MKLRGLFLTARLGLFDLFISDRSVLDSSPMQGIIMVMENQIRLDLARTNLAHHVRAFEVLRGVIHSTLIFGVGASSAMMAYGISKAEVGTMWAAVGGIVGGTYLATVTGIFMAREYCKFQTPAEGAEPKNLCSPKAIARSSEEFFKHEMERIQFKVDAYKFLNGCRGANLNKLVKLLLVTPVILLLAGLLGLWLV